MILPCRWPIRLLTIIACVTAACSSDEPRQLDVVRRDSAGIEIVENQLPEWDAAGGWVIGDSATLELGEAAGAPEYTFTYPSASQFSDGRVLVSDFGYKELRFYSPEGSYLRTVGGEGEGPGEFNRLSTAFVLPSDTVEATDHALRRLTVFSPSGDLVSTIQLEPRGTQMTVSGALAARRWAATASIPAPDSAGIGGLLEEIAIYGSDGAVIAVIDTLTESRRLTHQADIGILISVLPFGPRPSVTAFDGKVYVTPGDRYEIREYGGDGSLRRIIRRDWEPEAVTNDDISEHLEHVKDQFARFDTPDVTRETFLEMNERAARLSTVKPAIRALTVDRSGHLWVQPWDIGWRRVGVIPAITYDVFDPDGRWLGQVETPAGHWVTDIGDDYVWTVWSDEMEVNYTQRLPLLKSGSSP